MCQLWIWEIVETDKAIFWGQAGRQGWNWSLDNIYRERDIWIFKSTLVCISVDVNKYWLYFTCIITAQLWKCSYLCSLEYIFSSFTFFIRNSFHVWYGWIAMLVSICSYFLYLFICLLLFVTHLKNKKLIYNNLPFFLA